MMSVSKHWVVRTGEARKCGHYVQFWDGDRDLTLTTSQARAAHFTDQTTAEMVAIGIGKCRVVRLVPRTTHPLAEKKGNGE